MATQTITFPTIPTQTYSVAPLTLNATASSGLTVSYAVTSGPAFVSGNTLTITGAGSVAVQASQIGNATYLAATPVSQTFTVNQATPNISWSNPSDITYGTLLTSTQLDATSPVPGTFNYTPPAETMLNAGAQTLSAVFTPTDAVDFATVSVSTQINVSKATPIITWNNPADITYPAALSGTQLNASILPAGAVGFWPFEEDLGTTTQNALKSDSATLENGASWAPGKIGSALLFNGASQYADAGNTADLQVSQGDFTVAAWVYFNGLGGDMSIVDKMLDRDNANDNGWRLIKQGDNRFWFCIGLQVGINSCYGQLQSQTVPTTGVWYHVAGVKTSNTLTIFVNGVEEASTGMGPINDNNGGDLLFGGNAKEGAYLNGEVDEVLLFNRALTNAEIQNVFTGTQSTHGTFSYTPSSGTVLGGGSGQTLSTTFTPADTTDFNTTTQTASINVNPAAQAITFPTIPTQTYGVAPLTLNATASSGLTVSYAVTAGLAYVTGNILTITGAGSVTVQASQAGNTNYAAAAQVSQTFIVNQASQTIMFTQSAPAQAPYNSSFTVAATASSGQPVSFSSSGVCTNLGATFTMTNSTGTCTVTANQPGNANYLAAPAVTLTTTATKAAQTVTFTGAPATAPYQSTFTVTATTNTGITPTITATGSCSISGATVSMKSGTGLCTMTAKWAGNTNYLATTAKQTTTAEKLASTVTWTPPAAITYGTALSGVQLDATANVAGSFVYSPAAGTVPKAGNDTLKVTFTPTLSKDYTTATASVLLQVNQATPTITWTTPAAIPYGTALSGTQLDATASFTGKFVYSPAAGKVLTAATQTLSVLFTPTDHVDYSSATDTVTLVVNKVDTTTTITSNTPNPSLQGKAVLVHFTVTSATNYKAPTGKVTVNADTGESCTGTLVNGSGSCSMIFNTAVPRTLTATYAGDGNDGSSISPTVTQTVN